MRALFLDAAGTLIHLREPVATVYTRLALHHGVTLDPQRLKSAFRETFQSLPPPAYADHQDGDAAERLWWQRLVHTCLTLAQPHLPASYLDPIFHDLFAHYASPHAWTVDPSTHAVLDWATQQQLATIVVSNFDRRLHHILRGLNLHFTHIITSADACARKPDPRIFRFALAQGPYAPHEVAHIGDTPDADLHGAQSLGIQAFCLHPPQTTLTSALEWLKQLQF